MSHTKLVGALTFTISQMISLLSKYIRALPYCHATRGCLRLTKFCEAFQLCRRPKPHFHVDRYVDQKPRENAGKTFCFKLPNGQLSQANTCKPWRSPSETRSSSKPARPCTPNRFWVRFFVLVPVKRTALERDSNRKRECTLTLDPHNP